MTRLIPAHEPTPVTLAFRYLVSREYIETYIDATGAEPPERWDVEVDLTEVSTELRQKLRYAHRRYDETEQYAVLGQPTEDPELIADAVLAQVYAEEAERQRAQRERDAHVEEMGPWINEFGSPRLRAAAERNYNVNRLYAIERAHKDLPGFWVDFGNRSEARERANPSMAALELEGQVAQHLVHRAQLPGLPLRIVWLTKVPRDLERFIEEREGDRLEPWDEQAEALRLEGWLGRYTLFLPVDESLRVPGGE